jgi:hypothetical protein
MATTASPDLVHYFDTKRHLLLCGAGGFELRSTKHPRGVTCAVCIELLAAKPTTAEGASGESLHRPMYSK